MRTVLAAALLLLGQPACSGRTISSWAPSGSLDWDDRPGDLDEPADGGDGGTHDGDVEGREGEEPVETSPSARGAIVL